MIDRVSKAVLRHLFQKYLEAPTVVYAINRITDLSKSDAIEISTYMMEKNWVREVWVHQSKIVTCRITVQGIQEINPSFITIKVKKLVTELMRGGGKKSLAEIFQYNIQEYAIALDIVYRLEKSGFITMAPEKGVIHVELTAAGWHHAERQGKSLLALMAVA